ncbi:MAG TPA: heparan-alpha-glucosaminide N-acetyltransferase domain-containing protein [Candidatus Limnocylindria bacterium]|jgi:predicted acyltransferase|nr:heparan-alpha-glucosaminide N-acetyltransferase domain-containing protein [Candidatus Limnocylindria bacterium]
MSTESTIKASPAPKQRLASLDALRGFDMFWIVGGDSLAQIFANFGPTGKRVADQFEHADWEGFHFEDLIFPLFVFMAGVSLVFSLGGKMAEGGKAAAFWRLARRGLLLVVLGMLYYRNSHPESVRVLGVLQRIGIAYFAAGALYLFFKPRALIGWCAAILLGYWAMLALIPVPGVGAGHFEEGKNLTNWVDSQFLPGFKWDGQWDPEGLLSTLPAVASCLLGVFAGLILRDPKTDHGRRLRTLVVVGLSLIVVGVGWGMAFPIIKKLWTSSFVCFAGGWSFLFLAVFYYLIDVRGWQRWAQPFIWIGMNSITVYLIRNVVSFKSLATRVTGGPLTTWLDASAGKGMGNWVTNLLALGICLAVARFLYVRKIFLRV